jgi:hypothetical protein
MQRTYAAEKPNLINAVFWLRKSCRPCENPAQNDSGAA